MNRRVFVDDALTEGQSLTLTGEQGHHFARVLRLQVGEMVVVAASDGPREAYVEASDAKRGEVVLRTGERVRRRDPVVSVYVIQSLAKGDKVDEVVARGTELGVAGFCVAPTARSIGRLQADRQATRVARWQRIAVEAAGQAQRDCVPTVAYCATDGELSAYLSELRLDLTVLLDEREEAVGLKEALHSASMAHSLGRFGLVVGPEGGWDEADRGFWQQKGARCVSLGGRILRTETAGLIAAAAVLYEAGELGR